ERPVARARVYRKMNRSESTLSHRISTPPPPAQSRARPHPSRPPAAAQPRTRRCRGPARAAHGGPRPALDVGPEHRAGEGVGPGAGPGFRAMRELATGHRRAERAFSSHSSARPSTFLVTAAHLSTLPIEP